MSPTELNPVVPAAPEAISAAPEKLGSLSATTSPVTMGAPMASNEQPQPQDQQPVPPPPPSNEQQQQHQQQQQQNNTDVQSSMSPATMNPPTMTTASVTITTPTVENAEQVIAQKVSDSIPSETQSNQPTGPVVGPGGFYIWLSGFKLFF
jgi:flagellar biosynthesis/type III secretory pathway M-ring protein FliF/YscJ